MAVSIPYSFDVAGDNSAQFHESSASNRRADQILAALRALPLSEEPRTEEEDAIFRQIEADVVSGTPGITGDELWQTIDQI